MSDELDNLDELTEEEVNEIVATDIAYEESRTDKCEVCGSPAADGEMTCGLKSCRMEYWDITPDEIYEDLFYGTEDEY